MKIFFIIILSVSFGFLLGKFTSFNSSEGLAPVSHETWAYEGKKKIELIPDQASQLEEAEKYYGKAVILFLASLYNANNPSANIPSATSPDKPGDSVEKNLPSPVPEFTSSRSLVSSASPQNPASKNDLKKK